MSKQSQIPIEQKSNTLGLSEQLRQELVGGLLYCHHRANTNTSKTLEVTAFAYALIELLIDKGVLTEEELNERKRKVGERLVEKLKGDGMGVMLQGSEVDKYKFEGGATIDCENRVHLCKAACCRLGFALSRQDIEERVVKWDLSRPYMNRRGKDGYCIHLGQGSCRCKIYENRPVPCRGYDCREDKRIWADFENKIVSPELEKLFQDAQAEEVNQNDSRS
jgi:Fe-S-cluster containining protein